MKETSKISVPALIFTIVLLGIVVFVLYSYSGGGKNKVNDWDAAANAPAEQAGLSGVSEEERYNLRDASKAPSADRPQSLEEQRAFLEAAAMLVTL